MTPYLGEFFGTFLLMLMGGCVNANLDLARTKGSGAGWILMSWGWGLSVFLGVYTAIELGGSGHLNPAISIGFVAFGQLDGSLLAGYIAAQMAGAFCGAVGTWAAFRLHFEATDDPDRKLGVFSTSPAIRHSFSNFFDGAHRHVCACLWGIGSIRPNEFARSVGRIAGGIARCRHWYGIGWAHGICHQSCTGFGAAHCPLRAANIRQTR